MTFAPTSLLRRLLSPKQPEPEHPAHNPDDAEQVLKRRAKSGR